MRVSIQVWRISMFFLSKKLWFDWESVSSIGAEESWGEGVWFLLEGGSGGRWEGCGKWCIGIREGE